MMNEMISFLFFSFLFFEDCSRRKNCWNCHEDAATLCQWCTDTCVSSLVGCPAEIKVEAQCSKFFFLNKKRKRKRKRKRNLKINFFFDRNQL